MFNFSDAFINEYLRNKSKIFRIMVLLSIFNAIYDGLFRGCSRMGEQKGPPSLKSATHILQWWNLAQLYLTQRRSKKYMNHVTHSLRSADIIIFHRKSANFAISRNNDIDCIFWSFTLKFELSTPLVSSFSYTLRYEY